MSCKHGNADPLYCPACWEGFRAALRDPNHQWFANEKGEPITFREWAVDVGTRVVVDHGDEITRSFAWLVGAWIFAAVVALSCLVFAVFLVAF